jgi:hypothetical protein
MCLEDFERNYRQQMVTFFENSGYSADVFDVKYLGADYPKVISEVNMAGGGLKPKIPESVATELLSMQDAAISKLNGYVKSNAGLFFRREVQKIKSLCLNDLVEIINSGILCSQIKSVFLTAANSVSVTVNEMVHKQIGVMVKAGANTPSALNVLNADLSANGNRLISFYETNLNTLSNQTTDSLTTLIRSLDNMVKSGVKNFQEQAILQVNKISSSIFGMPAEFAIPSMVEIAKLNVETGGVIKRDPILPRRLDLRIERIVRPDMMPDAIGVDREDQA